MRSAPEVRANATDVVALDKLDRRFVLHPATSIARHLASGSRVVQAAEGIRIVDAWGHNAIDAIAGLWCVNIGYGREEVVEAMAAQARTLAFYHSFSSASNEPQIRLAERLIGLAPGRMSRVFFCNSGSEANDTQIKIVRHYNNLLGRPEKKKIISRRGAYHGSTLASASLTGQEAFHLQFDLPMAGVLYADGPNLYRGPAQGMSESAYADHLADELERLILAEGPDTVAAFIAEPVMAGAGILIPPKGYFQGVRKVLDRYDVLFIADEVICGFGRLGRMFGSELMGIEPDLMTIAKGLTSGYFPLAACLLSEEVWSVLARAPGVFGHGFTSSGHPVGAAVALANLDILEREALPARAAETGLYLAQILRKRFSAHTHVGDVRCCGLLAGIEFVVDRQTKEAFPPEAGIASRVADIALHEGVVVRPLGNVVALAPALITTDADINEIVVRLGRAVDQAVPWPTGAGPPA